MIPPMSAPSQRPALVGGPARLLILSGMMLFVELALIRWLGSNVIYLAYFSNFVLLGSFLGIGIGFLNGARHNKWFPPLPIGLALFAALILIAPAVVEQSGSGIVYVGIPISGLPPYVILPIIFVVVAAVMACIAMEVAASFVTFPALTAYRLDITGSLLGIGVFSLLAFLEAPPFAWGLVFAIAYVALTLPQPRRLAILACLALVVVLASESFQPGVSWSPYYKITIKNRTADSYYVLFNGVPYQVIQSYQSMGSQASNVRPYDHIVHTGGPSYDVLVIGAGNGKDVEAALRHGAASVDAVDIDPRSVELGRQLNPDHPYDDPRVHVTITDGRAFLEHTTKKYDLIEFAGTDSVTVVLGQSSLRLESYLFTEEAMRTARDHLKPTGVFTAFNTYWQPWYLDRLAGTLTKVYSATPCVDNVATVGSVGVLTVAANASSIRCDTPWKASTNPVPEPASDNAPFPYLQDPGVPPVILGSLAAILLLALLVVRGTVRPMRRLLPYLDLFAMGAAFLLLETKSVVQFALLFGTTWVVNAMVFAGVLIAVLAAIEVARRVRLRSLGITYLLLLLSLVVAWFIPLQSLLSLDFGWRLAAAILYSFTPIFLANLVFAERFRDTAESTTAFAANLLGAMVGGTLEYMSLVIGYRNLLVAVAVLYGIAFLVWKRSGATLALQGA